MSSESYMPVIDLTGGLDPLTDRVYPSQPEGEPMAGENHAFWIHDETSGIQINGHLNTCENMGAYEQRMAKLYVTTPDGRTLFMRQTGGHCDVRTTSSGSLTFRRVEPFKRWTCSFVGSMDDLSVERNYRTGKTLDQLPLAVRFEIDVEMIVPPYEQGAFAADGLGPIEVFMGGRRYEQLTRVAGTLHVGDMSYAINGFGNRTHRWGVRDLSGAVAAPPFVGHAWAAGAFPDGTGFHVHAFPTEDGEVLWSEGVVARDGIMVAAKVLKTPWLHSYRPSGEQIEIALQTDGGTTYEITGETISSNVTLMNAAPIRANEVILFQSSVRYAMGGQTGINMLERSMRRSILETGEKAPH
jgi:hypothetical protein